MKTELMGGFCAPPVRGDDLQGPIGEGGNPAGGLGFTFCTSLSPRPRPRSAVPRGAAGLDWGGDLGWGPPSRPPLPF